MEPIKAVVGSKQQASKYTGVGQALTLIFKEEGIQVNMESIRAFFLLEEQLSLQIPEIDENLNHGWVQLSFSQNRNS